MAELLLLIVENRSWAESRRETARSSVSPKRRRHHALRPVEALWRALGCKKLSLGKGKAWEGRLERWTCHSKGQLFYPFSKIGHMGVFGGGFARS